MAKKKKVPKKEVIPEGMSRKDYADAAFRKKVTIINGCILLTFLIGVVAVIFAGWYNTKLENEKFERIEAAYHSERDSVKAQLQKIEDDGGSQEDKSQVKINVTDDTYYYWIAELDASYQAEEDSAKYAAFGGAEIHIQGMIHTKKFDGGMVQYWLYRNHSHGGAHGEHNHEKDGVSTGEMIPIELIFADDVEIPEDGTWVDVVGIVGPDSSHNLSGIRDAKMTLMDEPGNAYVE